jgi:hypothetical protein
MIPRRQTFDVFSHLLPTTAAFVAQHGGQGQGHFLASRRHVGVADAAGHIFYQDFIILWGIKIDLLNAKGSVFFPDHRRLNFHKTSKSF